MDFSLSSSLVGSAVLNPDKLSLDLQFAADKTLTARKGPTPTFTRASTATFVGSDGLIQSAAVDIPRFNHDIASHDCKGLLIEEQRTNLILRSESFNTTWAAIQLNTTGSPAYINAAEVAPDGTLTGELIIGNTSNSTHQFRQDVTVVGGTTYTLSCYFYGTSITSARHASIATIGLPTGGVDFNARFDVLAGTKATPVGFTSSTIEPAGNSWFRCSAVFTAAVSGTISFRVGGASSTSITYAGNNTNGIGVWGAQLEAGAFDTSYIPTVASSVVRSADVCSITGSDFTGFYNTVEGSFATSQIFNAPAAVTQGQIVFDVNDTTTLNRTRPVRNATNGFVIYANTVNGTQDVAIAGSTAMNAGAVTKFAGCMKANDFTIYLNNVSQGVDTVATMQSAPTTFTIGDVSSGVGARAPINGTISSIRYFRKRLSNAKLSSLTV